MSLIYLIKTIGGNIRNRSSMKLNVKRSFVLTQRKILYTRDPCWELPISPHVCADQVRLSLSEKE